MKPQDISILIVDDEPDVREVLKETFEAFGFNAKEAQDGKDALAKTEAEKFHLVLTDLRMPVMTGQELIKALREKNPQHPKILAISGYTESSVEELLDIGCDGFFAKPFNSEAIKNAIKFSLLRRDDGWKTPPPKPIKTIIEKRFATFDKLTESKEVRFGRSGLYLFHKFDLPFQGEHVEFSIKIADHNPFRELAGVGTVRWVRDQDTNGLTRGIGVEIVHLKPDSLPSYCAWLDKQNFKASVPK
jgi:CheY-like chemotaxis protein